MFVFPSCISTLSLELYGSTDRKKSLCWVPVDSRALGFSLMLPAAFGAAYEFHEWVNRINIVMAESPGDENARLYTLERSISHTRMLDFTHSRNSLKEVYPAHRNASCSAMDPPSQRSAPKHSRDCSNERARMMLIGGATFFPLLFRADEGTS